LTVRSFSHKVEPRQILLGKIFMIQFTVSEANPADGPVFAALSRMFAELALIGGPEVLARQQRMIGTPADHAVGMPNCLRQPIAPADDPSVGAPTGPEVFGTGAALPSAMPAPSTAGVGPSLIASEVQPSILTLPANAPSPVALLPVPGAAIAVDPAPVGALVLDADGLPWDMRINSTPARINDGDKKWKAKRGVSGGFVAQVQAELRQALSAGNAAPPAMTGDTAAAVPAPASLSSGVPLPLPVPVAAAGPLTPAVLPTALPLPDTAATLTPAPAGNSTMATIMGRVTGAIAAGTLTAEAANALAATVSNGKVSAFVMLAVAPALLPAYAEALTDLGVA
jgi:hypothetical protein